MFQFKFEPILNYRKQIEDTCQQELARSKKKWEKEREKLEKYYELWEKCIEEWRRIQKDSVSVLEVDLYQKYMVRLKREVREQTERVKSCFKKMEKKRDELLNARKDKKIMEKLEEYHFVEYNKDMSKREKKFLDEVATQRFNLKGYKN